MSTKVSCATCTTKEWGWCFLHKTPQKATTGGEKAITRQARRHHFDGCNLSFEASRNIGETKANCRNAKNLSSSQKHRAGSYMYTMHVQKINIYDIHFRFSKNLIACLKKRWYKRLRRYGGKKLPKYMRWHKMNVPVTYRSSVMIVALVLLKVCLLCACAY